MESPYPGPGCTDQALRVRRRAAHGAAGPAPVAEKVVATIVGIGTPFAPSGAGDIDDVRVVGANVIRFDLQLLAYCRELVGEEHVAGCGQLVDDLDPLGRREIDADALLAAVGVLQEDMDVTAHLAMTPLEARPRMASPRSTCSTLITSAPQSARMAEAVGTNVCSATSRMRTPFMMSVMEISPFGCVWSGDARQRPPGGVRYSGEARRT